jgi:hypothetical protein
VGDITDDVSTGVVKGGKAIAFLLLVLIGGVGLIWTPAGPLYPFFLAVSMTSRPLDRDLITGTLLSGVVGGVVGGLLFIRKRHKGIIGCVFGMLVGPFWAFVLAAGLAPNTRSA